MKTKSKKAAKPSGPSFLDYFNRWVAGEQLAKLAEEAGMKRSKFRRNVIQQAGGKDGFKQLRSEGAGGRHEPGANLKRRASGAPLVSDKGVKVVSSSKRWSLERDWRPVVVRVKDSNGDEKTMRWRECKAVIYVSPSGNRYVRAAGNERADLIMKIKISDVSTSMVRLRKLETSRVAKQAKEEQKLVERGMKALKKKRAEKRAKRKARKSAK